MSRFRLPVIPTIIVGLAVALMIVLGFWQLSRRAEKEAALLQYAGNLSRPVTAFPSNPTDERYMFRTVTAHCLRVVSWQTRGGQLPKGGPGWRHIASCATGAEGPGITVDIGMSADPAALPKWNGGDVRGTATWVPDATSALQRWLSGRGHSPRTLMIVSDAGLAGLARSPRPDPSDVPNNHLGYAVQWFLFAGVAVIIYLLALRRRARRDD